MALRRVQCTLDTPSTDSRRQPVAGVGLGRIFLCRRSDHSRMPGAIHVALNDGVGNTIRQVVDPDDLSQVGGFVVGDHADMLGHYDRQDSLIEGSPYNAGLFHSGAGFGDDEFFKLYRRVAEAILR